MSDEMKEADLVVEADVTAEEEAVNVDKPNRVTPKISDPAYMKTEEEINAQIEYVKQVSKRITVVLAIALALLFIGILAFR